MNNKDSLDNIRRKAPAPRKPNQITEELIPTQQMDLVNTQLVATTQQLQQLQDRYHELSAHHSMLLQELIGVQKTVVSHEQVMQNMMSFLNSLDGYVRDQRRNSKTAMVSMEQSTAGASTAPTTDFAQFSPTDDAPASPLQHASKLLHDASTENLLNHKNLENMNDFYKAHTAISTPPPDTVSRMSGAQVHRGAPPLSAGSSGSMGHAKLNSEGQDIVYPPGHSNGIDPMYSEHIHNIPYPLPSGTLDPSDPRQQYSDGRNKSSTIDPGWIRAPQILLVEDDPTCRRIGSKFLYSFKCHIDSAVGPESSGVVLSF